MPTKNLLIVDDQRDIHLLLGFYFKSQGYAVSTASSGPEALEIARQLEFDLALLDWQMPEMDGFTLCRALRTDGAGPGKRPAVWIMTGSTEEDLTAAAVEAGAQAVLRKPLNPATVVNLFDNYLADRAKDAQASG